MKVFFRRIHLYLSLAAGLFIFISCLTGTILVFEHEIDEALNKSRYYTSATGEPRLPLTVLAKNAVESTPKAKLAFVKVYSEKARTVEIGLITPEKKPEGEKAQAEEKAKKENKAEGKQGQKMQKGAGGKPSLTAYVDPYTGQVIEVVNRRKSFFFTVEMLHRWLLTGKDGIGKTITGISTFFFLFILITGVILWWPKTKNILKQRLKIKSNAGWKRINNDLHIVTGFYTAIFLLIIVASGLTMSYNWINKGIFSLTGSKMENPEPPSSGVTNSKSLTLQDIFLSVSAERPEAEFYSIRAPKDPVDVFSVNILAPNAVETASDTYYIDQYTGKTIKTVLAADKNTGQKIRSYMKPIHTGAVFGLPSKIISFIVCLLSLMFPVTGVIMWQNRVKGKKNKAQKVAKKTDTVLA